MPQRWMMAGLGSLVLLLAACDEPKESPGAATAKASAAATTKAASTAKATASATAQAGAGKCDKLGCKGEGSFFKKCDCKGKDVKPPLTATWTGKDGSFDKPAMEVQNLSDQPLHWASVRLYYYDQAGKQLEVTIKGKPEKKTKDTTYKTYMMNGSTFTLKPKEKKTLSFGWKKDEAPKGTDTIEAVFDGWCWGEPRDKANEVCVTIDRAPDERPKGG